MVNCMCFGLLWVSFALFLELMGVPTRWPTCLRNRLCYMQFTKNGMLFPLHLSLKNVEIMSHVDTDEDCRQ
ncbi:hypothetical protein Gotur_031761 [Gossypium turneri]